MQNKAEENPSGDDRSQQAIGYVWAARISNIGLEMVFPALIGVGLDRLFGTVALFVILGMILGVALGFWQLIKIASKMDNQS
ncbi:MAG: AtpZ/AtpI family protein [Planctomycetaceae bacterium]|nr:AtpZ/AtpI family protein [Planctomycetaceae bacterium]